MTFNKSDDFLKSKIYERLEFVSMPENYSSEIPWVVQNQISATNGVHYADRVGKLKNYPKYNLPVPEVKGDKLMLDIGSGWGRWLDAGSRKGYVPVGVDIRLEFCETQQNVLKGQNIKGYSVVGDLECLPFQDNIFDLVWSFSVIQHTHIDRLTNCLNGINKILTNEGYTFLEFPNKNGLRNRVVNKKYFDNKHDDYNSWDVRYYTIEEYKGIFDKYLANFDYKNHSVLGIGVLPEDMKYVSFKNKIKCMPSLVLSKLTNVFPGLTNYSDSIFIKAEKKVKSASDFGRQPFFEAHKNEAFDNLNIVRLLKCPITGADLTVDATKTKVISSKAGMYYPIVNQIPILIKSEAKSL